jgi:hypothetical protein
MAFLLVWGKDSYTKRLLVLLPCTCVSLPALVHLCQTSLLLPWSPSHSGLCQFKITIFAPLQWAHKTLSNFRFLSLSLFLLCMFLPLVCDPGPITLLHLF